MFWLNCDDDHWASFVLGTLVFKPGESQKSIPINIVDDDVFEEDEHFYVNLTNLRVGGTDGMFVR